MHVSIKLAFDLGDAFFMAWESCYFFEVESEATTGLWYMFGTEYMEELIDLADNKGKMIALTPSTDFGATSIPRLKKFYKRFGFVENKGKNKDYEISETMYRQPRKPKVEHLS